MFKLFLFNYIKNSRASFFAIFCHPYCSTDPSHRGAGHITNRRIDRSGSKLTGHLMDLYLSKFVWKFCENPCKFNLFAFLMGIMTRFIFKLKNFFFKLKFEQS